MKNFLLLMLSVMIVSNAHSQTMNKVVFSFDHKVGVDPLVLGKTVFTIWNNKKVILTRAEFYISEVEIQNPNGNMMPLTDQYLLIDASKPTDVHEMGPWDIEGVRGVKLHLGVDPAHNHADPSTYASDHPLSLQNPTMHWGWSAGYRFMAIEGKVDNNGDGKPETAFEFHNVGDEFYRALDLQTTVNAKDGTLDVHLILDYAQLFKNIVMTGSLIQHGNSFLNSKMTSNAETEKFITAVVQVSNKDIKVNSQHIDISPNPMRNEATVSYSFSSKNPLTMVVMNAFGQTLSLTNNLDNTGSILLQKNHLVNGVYQIVFYDNGNLLSRKQFFVIQ